MEVKITKRRKLHEVCNDMCHNWYYEVSGRIMNDERTRYRRFHFVVWFDIIDLQEYYDQDCISKKQILDYVTECAYAMIELINSYDDCEYFYEMCRESIDRYNGHYRRCA